MIWLGLAILALTVIGWALRPRQTDDTIYVSERTRQRLMELDQRSNDRGWRKLGE